MARGRFFVGEVGREAAAGFREGRLGNPRRKRLEALPGWAWNTREAAWEHGFVHLRRFVKREGHARVPVQHREAGFPLGRWVDKQRRAYLEDRLAAERQARLEARRAGNGPGRNDLGGGFAHLQRFVKREGHARVPRGWQEDGSNLGAWATQQRSLRRRGRLDPDRRARLEGLHGWAWDLREATWKRGSPIYSGSWSARGIGESHSHGARRATSSALGSGINGHGGTDLARSNVRDLNSSLSGRGMLVRRGGRMDTAACCGLRRKEGHGRVPHEYRDDDGYQLGAWVTTQRRFRKRGWVSKEHAERLEAVPGWAWDAREAAWDEAFSRLECFVEREGHAGVPDGWREDGYQLGTWVDTQRWRHRQGTLKPERRARLQAVPGWTWSRGKDVSRSRMAD